MNIEPTKAYVYQPLPPQKDGKFYGVGGLVSFGLSSEEARLQGVTKDDAKAIATFCNENPEFAKNFILGIKSILQL